MVLGWLLVARFVRQFVAQIDTDAAQSVPQIQLNFLHHCRTNSPNLNRSHPKNYPPNYSNFPDLPKNSLMESLLRNVWVRWIMRSVENAECGKCGVWKMQSVENAECGVWKMRSVDYAECGVWKMRSVENAECGKCGVWKMKSVENAEWNVNKLIKKMRCIIAFFRCAIYVIYYIWATNVPAYHTPTHVRVVADEIFL